MPPARTRLLLASALAPVIAIASIAAARAGREQTPAAPMAVPASGTKSPPSLAAAPADVAQPLPSAVRWTVAISAHPAASPVVDGSRVFLVLQSGIVTARRLSDGGEIWRVELRTDRPVAADADRVFISSGEAIHALNAATSEVLWRAPVGTITAPLVAHEGWVVAATDATITAFRATDGTKVWSRSTGAQRERATIDGDNLYLPLDDGRLLAVDLQTGAERWSREFTGPLSEVLAIGDRIYVGSADKYFYCLNAGNGQWALEGGWRQWVGAVLRGRPAADQVRVFAASMDNAVRAFDLGDGALRWNKSVPFRPTRGPAVIGSRVVVPGMAAQLGAFDAATGRPAGQIALGAEPVVAPAFAASGSETLLAAVTGGLEGQWKLVLTEPPLPAVTVVPLTDLPGITVPVEPPAPKG